jgi:outer membrane protein OmpA-like peptidoglycan-associated protein
MQYFLTDEFVRLCKVRFLLAFIGVVLFSSFNARGEEPDKYKNEAVRSSKIGDLYNAIFNYEKYFSFKESRKDIKSRYNLSILYFKTRDYKKANETLDSVFNISTKKFPLAWYYKGLVNMNLENYNAAIESFTKFKNEYKSKRNKNNYWKLASLYIESSEWANIHMDTSKNISINHLGKSINNSHLESSPFPIDENTFLYSSYIVDTANSSQKKIYKAVKENGRWKSIGSIKVLNDPVYNTGNPAISFDGERLYFTRDRINWKEKKITEIWMSRKENNEWQQPEKLPYPVNDENFSSSQPAIGFNRSTGKDVIYFVSDRKGGKGGYDIWFTEYNSKTKNYKEPKNIDKSVNSIGDECSPFYDNSSSTLYFSSNGRNGLGGFDIYKSTGYLRKWTAAEPLPLPINSSYDDYFFSILSNNREGFFASNRPGSLTMNNGTCCDDIFYFRYNECAKIKTYGTVTNATNTDFYDHLNAKYHLGLAYTENTVLYDVPVELYLKGDNDNEEIFVAQTRTNIDGKYYFDLDLNKNYKILIKNYGYFDKTFSVSTAGVNCNDSIDAGYTQINYLPKITVTLNIYYEHNKSNLTDEAKSVIDTALMPLFDIFPNAIVEIGSHTDSTGSDEYNIDLSQRRSESVVNYLISKKVSIDKLVAKGYGESKPIAPNSMPDGSDNPEGRQKNRRTEFKVVGELNTFNIDDY